MSWRKVLAGVATMAVLVLVAGGVRSVMAQDKPKPVGGAQGQGKDVMEKAHKDNLANWKKAVDASKTSLVQAVQNAEKEMKGKAYQANIRATKEGKPVIHVDLFVGDQSVKTTVDPDTGKVSKTEEKPEEGG